MKKVILLIVALVLTAGSVNAGPMAYIGVYTDAGHEVCNQMITPGGLFYVWIWVLPDDNGMICTEFQLINPYAAQMMAFAPVENPASSVILGTPLGATGVSICFATCQTNWTWLFQIGLYPMAAVAPGFITIGPRPDAGAYQVADCQDGYPIAPLTILNNLAINQGCMIANEDASWGAIKGMYNE